MKRFFAIFLFSSLAAAAPKMSFQDSYVRYLAGHDIFRLFAQKFPNAKWETLADCRTLTERNRAALGVAAPGNGQLIYPGPSAAYVKWYLKCVTAVIDSDVQESARLPDNFRRFFGPSALAAIAGKPYAAAAEDPRGVPWQNLPAEVRHDVAAHLLHQYIGPEILKMEAPWLDRVLAATVEKPLSTFDAIKKLVQLIASQDEFLAY